MPREREVEEHNTDHRVFRSWCPHCVKGRGEAYGHPRCSQPEPDLTHSQIGLHVPPFRWGPRR